MVGNLPVESMVKTLSPAVRVQCSIQGSTLGNELAKPGSGFPLYTAPPDNTGTFPAGLAPALTESPLKALQGNQDPVEFWGVFISAYSLRPAFNLLDTNWPPSGDPVQDATNADTYCLVHDYGVHFDGDPNATPPVPPSDYEQIDTIDGSTFAISSAVPKNSVGDTQAPLNPTDRGVLRWPNIPDDGTDFSFAKGSNIFDEGPTRQTCLQALISIDFSKFWSGEQILCTGPTLPDDQNHSGPYISGFLFDRGSATSDGVLKEVSGSGIIPFLFFPNEVGFNNPVSSVDIVGEMGVIGYTRSQIQIRNFTGGIPLEYTFVEHYGGSRYNADSDTFTLKSFYRPARGGLFIVDRQIVDVPIPSISSFPTTVGDYVLTAASTNMLIGQSFEGFLVDQQISSDQII